MNPLSSIYLSLPVVGEAVATIAAILIGLKSALAEWPAAERAAAFWLSALGLIGWFALAFGFSRAGAFSVRRDQIPAIGLWILIPILLAGYLLWRSPRVSRLLAAVPRHWLVGIQVYRVLGVIFLLLYGAGKLPGVFALPAGLGDLAIGLAAPYVAHRYARDPVASTRLVRAWNRWGIIDLAVAVFMGFFSSPSPLQMFSFDAPNLLITVFPLVLIPVFLVPLAVALHLASLKSLREVRQPARSSSGALAS